ncbi:MAG: hypothetical protein JWR24_5612 [Actinoallomurus sp.]|nr:hypothetical protein [Actinoallomurus sp.]
MSESQQEAIEGNGVWDDLEDDQEAVDPGVIGQAVVTDTAWTTETLLSQLRRGNIQLNPRFQRRDAWDRTRKSKFIESLILALPIPQLVLAEDKKRRGSFIVLDGKQRLLALRQFAAGSSFGATTDDEDFTNLRLSGLDVRQDLRLTTLEKLEDLSERIDDLNSFLNQTIRTVVVRSWPNEEFLNLVFLRLNTGSVKLSPQELRQALHPGPFTDFLDDHSATSTALQLALKISRPDFRMRDVEILLRYFAFQNFLDDYRGDLKKFLDRTVERLNGYWTKRESEIRRQASECDAAIEFTIRIFNNNAFFRWSDGKYERRFNRAVFDIMVYYFANAEVRNAAERRLHDIEPAFQMLCERDANFVEAIQTTTKSIGATYHRLSAWGNVLSDALDIPLTIPGVDTDGYIVS